MKRVLFVVVALLCAVPVMAQTKPVNPRTLEVNPDVADYPNITRLEVGYFLPGATQPVSAPVSIGKPPITSTGCTAPVVDPCVRVTVNTMVLPFGADYVAKVWAVAVVNSVDNFSPWSPASNPFDRRPAPATGVAIK